MILKFKENKIKGCSDGWAMFSEILNVYHYLIPIERYLELCKGGPTEYPFSYTAVDKDKVKLVRIINITKKNGSSSCFALGNTTVYLLNEDVKTIEAII